MSNTKVKVIERVGNTLKSQLVRSNPWGNSNCPRPECLPCTNGPKNFDCKRRSVVYMTTCKLCQSENKKVSYIGETSNSMSERMSQHLEDALDVAKDSHMRRHLEDTHGGETL